MKLSKITNQENKFLQGSLGSVFFKTAAPIIFMMLVNGSFTLVDAYFLGTFVGAEALVAVTSMFPAFIFLIALSTLVSSGFSSVIARLLGANKLFEAKQCFAQASSLAVLVAILLNLLFAGVGHGLTLAINNNDAALASMSYQYISILVFCSPLMFLLTLNSDCLRSEGHISIMALVSLSTVILNAVFNYLLIVHFKMGVAGSAIGTVAAQSVGLLLIGYARMTQTTQLSLPVVTISFSRFYWKEFLSIGVPSSLTHIGIALASGAIFFNLQIWSDGNYVDTVGAYGILNRIMTFIYLPILGLSLGFQTIVGNNVGAKEYPRVNSAIKIAISAALIYCLVWQWGIYVFREQLGSLFVDDIGIIQEVARISPVATLSLFILGPALMITVYFQAIGDAKRAGLLSIAKTYLFLLPLLFILPYGISEWGVWYAGPIAELLSLLLIFAVLIQRRKATGHQFGLFYQ
jgi:putative MATE family efflux protein